MITVATVLWQGDFRGRRYSPHWVQNLKNMVDRHLSVEHDFVCLSNVDVPTRRIPLEYDYPGWWSKLELFKPNLPIDNKILFIDLDTIIIDNINGFVTYDEDLVMCDEEFTDQPRQVRNKENTITFYKYSSKVVLYRPGTFPDIWNNFSEDIIEKYRGDQDWINTQVQGIKTFPQKWFMRTKHCKDKKPEGPKMICGNPIKPDEAAKKWKWAKEEWR